MYNPLYSDYRYKSVKLTSLIFCILLPIYLILSFLLESESYIIMAVAFIMFLYFISYYGISKRIETMRYFSIMLEFILFILIILYIISFFSIELIIVLFLLTGPLENIIYLFDKNIYSDPSSEEAVQS